MFELEEKHLEKIKKINLVIDGDNPVMTDESMCNAASECADVSKNYLKNFLQWAVDNKIEIDSDGTFMQKDRFGCYTGFTEKRVFEMFDEHLKKKNNEVAK